MISNKDIRYEKSFYENLRKHYKNKARGYPEGALCFRFQHGTHRPFLNLNGELTYLNKNNKRLISRLMEKRINESMLKHIENNMNGNESGIVLGVCMKITEQGRYASRSG